jgi:hypothetical protein
MEKYIVCLKINEAKLDVYENFFNQFQKISDYLIKRKNLNVKKYSILFGMINDDFIKNKLTLKITYKLKK